MPEFLIISHSSFAEGLYNAIKFFKNDVNNVHYLNAYIENQDFTPDFINKVKSLSSEELVVISDMAGGSVNQIATRLMDEYGYRLITGVNLPLALELVFTKELTDEKIRTIITRAREQLIFMNDLTVSACEESDDL